MRFSKMIILGLLIAGAAPGRSDEPGRPLAAAAAEGSGKGGAPLDVNITGEASDDRPLRPDPPTLDVSFEALVPLSTDEQVGTILAAPVDTLGARGFGAVDHIVSRQADSPGAVGMPPVPSLGATAPEGLDGRPWAFEVVGQEGRAIFRWSGDRWPRSGVSWDGYEGGVFRLRAGRAYATVLTVTDSSGTPRSFFGSPARWDVVQYREGARRHVEFANAALFRPGAVEPAEAARPLWDGAVHLLRRHAGGAYQLVIFHRPGEETLARRRLAALSLRLRDDLAVDEKSLPAVLAPPSADNGDVTRLTMADHVGEAR